ncbi:MAG TPA: hypothetical protein VGB17_02840, partial [Pyrinomonadaceae bacterium]
GWPLEFIVSQIFPVRCQLFSAKFYGPRRPSNRERSPQISPAFPLDRENKPAGCVGSQTEGGGESLPGPVQDPLVVQLFFSGMIGPNALCQTKAVVESASFHL